MAGRYTKRMEALRASYGNQCAECGSSSSLEFAHIKPTPLSGANGNKGRGRGMPQRYHDIKKHPDCYELLCPACHSKKDPYRYLAGEKKEEEDAE